MTAMTSDDARRWRRLIDAANLAVERPADSAKAGDFKHWAGICQHRGILPGGSVGEDAKTAAQPFRALIGFGAAWPAMTIGDRRSNADAVLAAIEGCAAQLGEPVPPDPQPERGWKARADING